MPERLGRFEIRAKIGEGGMAAVYLGHANEGGTDRVYAIKVIKEELSLNSDFVIMFMDEARIVSRLNHPNIVRVLELGNEGSRLFLAMELLFGQSLWHVWNACRERGVRLRYDVACWIGARIAEGLHHAHELRDEKGQFLNIVHRDVNASNVFVTYDGQVKIIDFGLAKAANRVSKTAAGVVKGKLAYMSPEQAIGNPLDRRSDIFALGTTLWEITVDRRLFKGTDDIDTLKRVHAAEVPDPTRLVEGFPPYLWQVLRKALAREPEARYQTALDFARELDRCSQAEGRIINARTVADIMGALFGSEQVRQEQWIAEASSGARTAHMPTMQPPAAGNFGGTLDMKQKPSRTGTMSMQGAPGQGVPGRSWTQGPPPEGMFGPPSRPRAQESASATAQAAGALGPAGTLPLQYPHHMTPQEFPSQGLRSSDAPSELGAAGVPKQGPSRASMVLLLIVAVTVAMGLGVGAALLLSRR